MNINATRNAIQITVTGVSALGSDTNLAAAASDAQCDNRSAFDAYIKFGGSDVTADATCARVPAGAILVYGKGQATHVAVHSPGGTPALFIHLGEGN